MVALLVAMIATFATAPIGDVEGVGSGIDTWNKAFVTGEVTWPVPNVQYAEVILYKFENGVWEYWDDDYVLASGNDYQIQCDYIDPNMTPVNWKVTVHLVLYGGLYNVLLSERFIAPDDFMFVHPQWFHYKNFNFPK